MAADKRASSGSMIATVTKIQNVRGCLVGCSGDAAFAAQMLAWFRNGEYLPDFPKAQLDKDDYVGMLVIRPGGVIQKYERTPTPIVFEQPFFSIGSGREFAMAAMHLGKTAAEAVAVACALDCYCGNGIDTLTLDAGQEV